MDDYKPTKRFNFRAQLDLAPLREKDNAKPTLKPSFAKKPAPNLAPSGAMGIRRSVPSNAMAPSFMNIDSSIAADTRHYITGHFVSDPPYSFLARVNHAPTKDGLNGSRIDQLVLKEGDTAVFRYGRNGQDTDIAKLRPDHKAMVDRLCSSLPELTHIQTARTATTERRDDVDKSVPSSSRQANANSNEKRAGSNVSVNGGRDAADPWIDGRITTMPGYTFQAKLYDEPSKHGIDGGKISKLQVKKDAKSVLAYDRGWDRKPTTSEHKEALRRIRTGLGDMSQREFKAPAIQKERDDGIDL